MKNFAKESRMEMATFSDSMEVLSNCRSINLLNIKILEIYR
jgi:hypothetical protein